MPRTEPPASSYEGSTLSIKFVPKPPPPKPATKARMRAGTRDQGPRTTDQKPGPGTKRQDQGPKTSEHNSSLRGDATDLLCGETRGALCHHKMSVVVRQDLRGGKRQWRRPSAAPLCGSLVSCHHGGLVLPQQTSCVATAHLSCGHTSRFHPVPVPAGSGSCGRNRRRGSAGSVPTRFGSAGSGSVPPLPDIVTRTM